MVLAMAITAWLVGAIFPAPRQAPLSSQAVPSTAGEQPKLTLADALALARTRSRLVEAAHTRQRAAILARAGVSWLPNPSVELRGENYGPASERLRRDVFATVSQSVELGGDRRARVSEAEAMMDLADAEVRSAEWMTAFDVAALYLDALRAREIMGALIEQRQGVADLVAMLRDRVREGLSAEADLRKFETEHTRLASQVTRASISLQTGLQRLAVMIGQDVRAAALALPTFSAPPSGLPVVSEVSIANRADVQIAVARLQRAEATMAIERARRVPDLAVTAGYKRTDGVDTGVAGVMMGIPLFDRNRVGIAHAAGSVGSARFELEQAREMAMADARARWIAARELSEQAARIDSDLVSPAAVVRSAARSAFIEGRGDVLQLVDAERVYGEATREAMELRLDAMLAIVQARLAVGDPPLP